MLSIKIDDRALDLPDDVSVTLKFLSPLFNAVGYYSFPFTVPGTPKNKSILGWKHRVENSRDKDESFSAGMFWENYKMFAGTIRITSATASKYEIEFYLERGDFNFLIKDIILNELDLGYEIFEDIGDFLLYANLTTRKLYGTYPVAFPTLKNLTFFDPETTDPELQFVNLKENVSHNLYDYSSDQSRMIITPFLYLKWLLARISALHGYTIDDQFFTKQAELINLLVYNSHQANAEYGDGYMVGMFYKQLVPRLKITEFLTGLENLFNFSFFANSKLKTLTIKGREDILLDQRLIDFSKNVLSAVVQKIDPIKNITFEMSTDSGDPVMDTYTNADTAYIKSIKGIVEKPGDLSVAPFVYFLEPEDVYFVKQDGKFYRYYVPVSGNPQWIIDNVPGTYAKCFLSYPKTEGISFSTNFSFLADNEANVVCGNKNLEEEEITPRLFFIEKPLIVHEARSLNDNLAMIYGGEHGLVMKFWKKWADWIMKERKQAKITRQMGYKEISELDLSRKYRILGNNYLISELQVTLRKNEIKPAVIKAYSCN